MLEGWVLSFAFPSFDDAGPIYERARDLIFAHDVDGSVYRVVLNGRAHVVALGFVRLPSQLEIQLEDILSAGEDSILPEEILLALSIRHAEVQGIAMKYERRGSQTPTMRFD
jgi:hypothetical protein